MAKRLDLNAQPQGAVTRLEATQGENNARSYDITVIGLNSQPLDLTGCTVSMYVCKGDNIVQIPAMAEGMVAHITLPSGACDTPGEHRCWVQVIRPNTFDLRVDNLILRVQACNIDGAGEASAEFGTLTQLIVSAQTAIADTISATDQAAAAAQSATAAAQSANTAATAATTAAGKANTATGSANSAATAANTAAESAQTQADYAKTQGDAAQTIVTQWQGIGADNMVPKTRKINNKALSADISLTASDVGARPDTWTPSAADVHARPDTWTPTAAQVGAIDGGRVVLTATHSSFNNAKVYVARAGNMVTVTLPSIAYTKAISDYPPLCTLPEGYRPAVALDIFTMTTSTIPVQIMIYPNGQVSTGFFANLNTQFNLRLSFSFVI